MPVSTSGSYLFLNRLNLFGRIKNSYAKVLSEKKFDQDMQEKMFPGRLIFLRISLF